MSARGPAGASGGAEEHGSGADAHGRAGAGGEPGGPPQIDIRGRLDPQRAVAGRVAAGRARPGRAGAGLPQPSSPVLDMRRYQRMIGALGLALLVVFSIYLYLDRGVVRPGIGVGGHLHRFVAPLAGSGINRPANTDPRCEAAHPNRRALNVCGRRPLVLAFFVEGVGACVREVSTLQRIAPDFAGVQFAALAVRGGPAATTALVRAHGWRIPVAYDEDGSVGDIYGVEICPMIEVARRGGLVAARLIGERWLSASALRGAVRRALSPGG